MHNLEIPQGSDWKKFLAPYKQSDARKATFQVVSTALMFVTAWYLMLRSLEVSYVLTLALAVPAAGLLARLFIFQHDCGHGSFYTSRTANNTLGSILGIFTLTPYEYWRHAHAIHHASSGDLDRRGLGDVDTLTVQEYLDRPWHRRLLYRIYRSSLVLLFVGPVYQFLIKHRVPFDAPLAWKKEWLNVLWTNLAIVAVAAGMIYAVGLERFLLVHAPITLFTGMLGVWLFYVQHQFENTYWEEGGEWNFIDASLYGSSFYDLPKILHWFTGNIGYHHIHHLSSRIPNYHLRRCARENPELNRVSRISLRDSLRCLQLKLWDPERRKLISFRELRSAQH